LQQVNHRTVRRGATRASADGSGPLPQYDLGRWDAFDPDRTLQRLAIVPDAAPTPVWLDATALLDDHVGPASAPDSSDMAVTVEIVPEVDFDDILEAAPTQRAPLVLPPRGSAPIDLDRLLAQARAETRKSVDYFHPSTPLPPALAPLPHSAAHAPVYAPGHDRSDPTVAAARVLPSRISAASLLLLPDGLPSSRRRLGLIVASVLGAAVATIGVAALQSRVSSARSPSNVTVTTAVAAATPVRPPSPPVQSSPVNDIPTVSVQSLPMAPTATISLAAVAVSHRLFIDGRLANGDSQVVSCGRHLVQVGSRGMRRYVSVPCGQELVVAN
jgi:hypothetical protein